MSRRLGGHTEDGGIAPLEEDAHPAPQVGDGLAFLLPRVPCQGGTQLLHLPLCPRVPATKSLSHHGQESNALPPVYLYWI